MQAYIPDLSVILACDWLLGMFRTVVNIWGDGMLPEPSSWIKLVYSSRMKWTESFEQIKNINIIHIMLDLWVGSFMQPRLHICY